MRQHASQTEEASPSRDPAACIDRLYHRAVSRQRERAREYNEHVAMAVEKGSGKVRRSALRYHLKPEIERQLYSFPVELKRKHLEALKQAAALQPDINHSNNDMSATMDASRKKKLDSQEQMNLGQRLCNESLAHKQAVIKELQQRATELPPTLPSKHARGPVVAKRDAMEQNVYELVLRRRARTIDTAGVTSLGQRLCSESLKHRDEELQKLEEKFAFKRRTPTPVLSTEALRASCDRMFKGEIK